MSSASSREEGFALPMTIFIVTLVTIMLSALFVRVGVERRIADSGGATVDALAIAHSGLQRFYVHYDSLGTAPSNDPNNPDSLRVNVTGGYADVVAHIAHDPPGGDTMYLVRSTGHVIEPTLGADPQAERTVAQFALWQGGTIATRAAYLAANRFNDPDGFPDDPDAVPDGTYSMSAIDECTLTLTFGMRSLQIPGLPANQHPLLESFGEIDYGGTPTLLAGTGFNDIDWDGVVGGDFLPDYTSFTNWNTWSSYLIDTPLLTLPDVTGSGLLVVTGDLDLQGAVFDWRGVILVGGAIHFNAQNMTISGMVVSGLNYQLGPPQPADGVWNPDGTTLSINYNSCRVDSAMVALGGLAPIPNAWVDNWATY
jgi:hypothetical protein